MFYGNPRINNGDGIYNGGGGGGGGGGGANINDCFLLLSGIVESEPPIRGSITPTNDPDLPVNGIMCYRNGNADTDYGVAFGSNDFSSKLSDTVTGWTCDFWFRPIAQNETFTPHFFSFTSNINNDTDWGYDLTKFSYSDMGHFLWSDFKLSGQEFAISVDEWHHLAIVEHNIDSAKDERYLFVDGRLNNYGLFGKTSFNNMKIRFCGSKGRINYKLAQICFRQGVVWDTDFTPPTEPYRLY